ncbi:MAG: DUF1385 domain-containing protein [Eubacteriales bacterium]|nr:DUF1385 domain-containing protein [Eubacteriales bacterium]MDD4323808.1 DUF1385 domain-containing protein [Eubacteriales bacterium]MDD4541284.1 DUF1385 domain-containing protein [Eubacteriales bacterium]
MTDSTNSNPKDVIDPSSVDVASADSAEQAEPMPDLSVQRAAKKTNIGGQALIEGLMMLGPEKQAIALRLPSGEIDVQVKPRTQRARKFNVPFLRGSVRLVTQLRTGVSALMRSAELTATDEEEEETSKLDRFLERHQGFAMTMTVFVSLLLSVAIFVLIPSLFTDLIRSMTGLGQNGDFAEVFSLSLIEGVTRMAIFLLYVWSTSKMKEIKRVWQYHGAEHKTIACYEAGLPLTVENCREQPRQHPRCGTSFLFLFMFVSILVFALIGRYAVWINILLRLALVPLVAGITYEITRFAGRSDSKLSRILSKPGLALQNLTTAEPDDSMLEVSIAAMEAVIPENAGEDDW